MNCNSQSCGCENGLIDVIGLCVPANTTQAIRNTPYWKQMHITETLQIPEQKPDIEVINSVEVWVDILRKQVIKPPPVLYRRRRTPPQPGGKASQRAEADH